MTRGTVATGAGVAGPPAVFAPVSCGQRRLWYLQCLAPQEATYNIALAATTRQPLAVEDVRAALRAVVLDHEVLRSRYLLQGRELVQAIDTEASCVADVRHVDDVRDGGVREATRAAVAMAEQPVDLRHTGPLRATLIVGPDRRVLAVALAVHHIAWDEASTGIFWRQLSRNCRLGGAVSPRTTAITQYRRYAAWEREPAQRRAHDTAVRRCVAAVQPWAAPQAHDELEADRWTTPQTQVFELRLRPTTAADLQNWAGRRGGTPFAALLRAVATALLPITAGPSLRVAIDVSRRPDLPEFDATIGYFLTQVLVGIPRPGAAEVTLDSVRAALAAALDHRAAPYDEVVRALGASGRPWAEPFDAKVYFEQDRGHADPMFQPLRIERHAARHSLTVGFAVGADQRLSGYVSCSGGAALTARAQSLVGGLQRTLSALARDHDTEEVRP